METVVDVLVNWGFSNPGPQYLAGRPDPVYIDAGQWRTFSLMAFAIVAGIVLLAVVACYLPTRRVGQAFVRRWWSFAVGASALAGVAVLLYLLNATFVWNAEVFGFGFDVAVIRALIAAAQTLLYFYLASGASGVLFGRFLGVRGFVDNRQIPIPHIL